MTKTLRVHSILVQPVLVWDHDGEELEGGPAVPPAYLRPSKVAEYLASLPGDLAGLQAALEVQEEAAQAAEEEPANDK